MPSALVAELSYRRVLLTPSTLGCRVLLMSSALVCRTLLSTTPNTPGCQVPRRALLDAGHSLMPSSTGCRTLAPSIGCRRTLTDAEHYGCRTLWMPSPTGCRALRRVLLDAEQFFMPSSGQCRALSCLVKSPGNPCPPKCIAWPNVVRFESCNIFITS